MNNIKSVAELNFRFSNTNASRLMKLHTHFCHDVPCPLPSTVADLSHLDLFFMLGLTVFNVCHLTLFSNTNAPMLVKLYAMGISFSHNYYEKCHIHVFPYCLR